MNIQSIYQTTSLLEYKPTDSNPWSQHAGEAPAALQQRRRVGGPRLSELQSNIWLLYVEGLTARVLRAYVEDGHLEEVGDGCVGGVGDGNIENARGISSSKICEENDPLARAKIRLEDHDSVRDILMIVEGLQRQLCG